VDETPEVTTPAQPRSLASYFLLLVTLTVVSAFALQWLGARAAAWVFGALVTVTAVVTTGLFARADVWVPGTAVVASQLGCVLLVQQWKAARAHRATRRLLFDLSAAICDRMLPAQFADAAEHWPLLAGLVSQTLDVRRMVFLQAVGSRIDVSACFGTSTAEVTERRRDLTREPYASALKQGRPVRLDELSRPFLTPATDPECQFLAPLMHGDRVLGVWVVSADAGQVDANPDFADLLAGYARQFGEMLYQRDQIRAKAQRRALLGRLFAGTAEDSEAERLAHVVRALTERLVRAERVFAEGANPAESFDLFGRPREVNNAMRARLQSAGLAPYQMTAASLIAALSGRDVSFARLCVRHVLHDRRDLSLPIEASDGRAFLMRMKTARMAPRSERSSRSTPIQARS
jgi:hypothetical protein